MTQDRAMVKLDFCNAFNSIRRDSVLEAVNRHIPELLPLVLSAYGEDSLLHFGEYLITSSEGVQQGDPLGFLFLSVILADVLNECAREFVVAYLDDVTLGDSVDRLASQVADSEVSANKIGLSLNHGKTEMLGLSTGLPSCSDSTGLGFRRISPGEEELLG